MDEEKEKDHWRHLKKKRKTSDAGVQGEVESAESQRRRNRQGQMIQGVIDDIKNMGFRAKGTF